MSSVPAAAAIYARISSDPNGTALGVGRQVADCQALADRKRWPVAGTYVDNDVSAFSGKARPEYRRMLADTKAGLIDAVIVWHLDRLHRRPKELEEFFEACDAAGVLHLASVTGDIDLATHDGRFMARILGAVARKESDDKSRRIARKHLELAQAGRAAGGGTRPFGFELDRKTIRPEEADLIRHAAARFLAGDSLRSIARDLNTRLVPTSAGRPWTISSLRRVLRSARISGQREHRGRIVAKAEWPEIISPADGARIRAILDDPARPNTRPARRYLLTGFLRCGLCDALLVARPREDGTRRYVCARGPGYPGCGRIAIVANELEAWMMAAPFYRLDTPQVREAIAARSHDTVQDELLAELESDRLMLDELAAAFGRREISMTEWSTARKPIDARLRATERRLAALAHPDGLGALAGDGPDIIDRWMALTLDRRRALLRALVEHVTVHPAIRGRNTFDPNRLAPLWRL